MKNTNKFKKLFASLGILACMGFSTFAMTNAVFAATQHTIQATNNVEYVALQHVDAKISASYKNVAGDDVTVLDEKEIVYADGGDHKVHDNCTACGNWSIADIVEARDSNGDCTVWSDGSVAGTKELVVTFTVENTSSVDTNKLTAELTVTGTADNSNITYVVDNTGAVDIAKGATGTITVTFTVADYRHSDTLEASYSLSLTAAE